MAPKVPDFRDEKAEMEGEAITLFFRRFGFTVTYPDIERERQNHPGDFHRIFTGYQPVFMFVSQAIRLVQESDSWIYSYASDSAQPSSRKTAIQITGLFHQNVDPTMVMTAFYGPDVARLEDKTGMWSVEGENLTKVLELVRLQRSHQMEAL
jgi:hypothetical protein